MPHMTDIYKAT